MTIRAVWAMAVAMVVLGASASPVSQGGPTGGSSSTDQAAQSGGVAPAGKAENGRQLFRKVGCYQCHGLYAQGVSNSYDWTSGPRLAPSPMPFRRFAQYVRGAPRAPQIMPPYTTKVLPDQDLADIYAFLLSVGPPSALESIPLLTPSPSSVDGQPKKP